MNRLLRTKYFKQLEGGVDLSVKISDPDMRILESSAELMRGNDTKKKFLEELASYRNNRSPQNKTALFKSLSGATRSSMENHEVTVTETTEGKSANTEKLQTEKNSIEEKVKVFGDPKKLDADELGLLKKYRSKLAEIEVDLAAAKPALNTKVEKGSPAGYSICAGSDGSKSETRLSEKTNVDDLLLSAQTALKGMSVVKKPAGRSAPPQNNSTH